MDMRTPENDKDKNWQRVKEVLLEIWRELAFPLFVGCIIIAVVMLIQLG